MLNIKLKIMKKLFGIVLLFSIITIGLYIYNVSAVDNKSSNLSSGINSDNKKIRIGLLNSKCKPDNLPYLVAQKNGYFDGIDIEEISSSDTKVAWGDAISYADKYDVIVTGRAQLYFMEATNSQMWKVFIANVNTQDKNDYAILVRNGPEITDFVSLKGKTIGVERSSGVAKFVLIKMIINKLGLSSDNFNIIDASVDDLHNKNVDALYIREPQLSLALNSREYKIVLDAPIVKYIMDPWPQGFYAVSADFSKENNDVKEKMISALNKAVDFIKTNSKEANSILSECSSVTYGVSGVNFREFEYWKLGEFDNDAITKQISLYHEKELIPKSFPANDIILK